MDGDVGFEVVVVEVSAGEVGGAEHGVYAVGLTHDEHLEVALLAVGVAPAYVDSAGDQFCSHGAGGHALFLAAEGIAVGVE